MKHRWVAFVIMVVCFGLIYLFGATLPAELAPLEDRSEFRFMATAPEGATFEYMDEYIVAMTDFMNEEEPEQLSSLSITGRGATNSGFLRVTLVPPSERTRTQQQIVDDVSAKTKKFTGIRAYITQSQTIGDRRGGFPVQFVIQASEIEKLKNVIPTFLDRANESPLFTYVDVDLKFTKPEINILINRDKARNLGVNIVDISQTLQLGLSGTRFGYFIMNGKQYPIIGQVERKDRNEPLDLRTLYVRNRRGEIIQLDNLVTVE